MEFFAVYRPYKTEVGYMGNSGFEVIPGGYLFTASTPDVSLTALLPTDDAATLEAKDLQTTGAIKLKLEREDREPEILEIREVIHIAREPCRVGVTPRRPLDLPFRRVPMTLKQTR